MLRVLICPLNWGLGHATRCKPIIEALLQRGHEVQLAGDGQSLELLRNHYPQLKAHAIAPLHIEYGRNFWSSLFLLLPAILFWRIRDHYKIRRLNQLEKFDLVISDSRPGCCLASVYNILLISQISPILPFKWMERVIHPILYADYNKFDLLWIPDQEGSDMLSGGLIDAPSFLNTKRIGFLSQLNPILDKFTYPIAGRILAIVSGPEPLRSEFKLQLIEALKSQDVLIAGGNPADKTKKSTYISFLNPLELNKEVVKAEYIVCRGGYTTLMELSAFSKKLILVPTPGQSEQLYLAHRIENRRTGLIWDISHVNWTTIRQKADQLLPFYIPNDPDLLNKAIEEVENYCRKKINLHP